MNKKRQYDFLYIPFIYLIGFTLLLSNAQGISMGSFEKEFSYTPNLNKTLTLFIQNDNTKDQEIVLEKEGILSPYITLNESTFILQANMTHTILVTALLPQNLSKKEETFIFAKEKKQQTTDVLIEEYASWKIPISISDEFIAIETPKEVLQVKQETEKNTTLETEPIAIEEKETEEVNLFTANVIDESAKLAAQDEGTNANFSVGEPEKNSQTLRPTQIFFAVLSILLGITIVNITFLQKKTNAGVVPKLSLAGVLSKVSEKIKNEKSTRDNEVSEKNITEKRIMETETLIKTISNDPESKNIELEIYSIGNSLMQETGNQEIKKREPQREPQDELEAYIETQIESGFLIIDISEVLLRAGWDAEQIDIATREVFSRMKK